MKSRYDEAVRVTPRIWCVSSSQFPSGSNKARIILMGCITPKTVSDYPPMPQSWDLQGTGVGSSSYL